MKLSRVNTLLLIAIIGINTYVIVMPLLPQFSFWWRQHHTVARTSLEAVVHPPAADTPNHVAAPVITGDRLVVPSMLLNQQVYEGRDMRTLNKGLWLRPGTSTPDKGGNTVIVGHRFTYTNPRGTLYSLDKVRVGDEIALYWKHKKYVYRVHTVRVVPPDLVSIEMPTTDPQLTIYTCTPLWNPKDRLVITALPEGVKP